MLSFSTEPHVASQLSEGRAIEWQKGSRNKSNRDDIRIIIICLPILLIIHVLNILLSSMLSPFGIVEIHALCLDELVDKAACETDESFFGELVIYWLSCAAGHVSVMLARE